MMPLGLTGSLKAENASVAYGRDNAAKASSQNGGKADDFAKALGGGRDAYADGKNANLSEATETVQREDNKDGLKIDQGNGFESDRNIAKDLEGNGLDGKALGGLVNASDNSEIGKNAFDKNAKQIAFVTIDGGLAEKLSPIKVTASNKNAIDTLSVDADGMRKTASSAAESFAKPASPIDSANGDKQTANKVLNGAQAPKINAENTNVEKGNDKVVAEKMVLPNNKIGSQSRVINAATNSSDPNNEAGKSETGNLVGKEPNKNSASSIASARSNTNPIAKDSNASMNAEMADKASGDKLNAEKASDRIVNKFRNSTSIGSELSAAQVKVKPSNNTVSFLTESKIENLGNTLQQIATTSESKSGTQVSTVSAPRIVLPASQSVVPQKTIEIQLLPKTLGLIQVKIEVSDGKMNLMIEAQTAKAEAAIKQEVVQIIETIKAAGLSVEEISVRRNAELNQQDQAINEFSADENLQENFANGEFGDHFDDQKDSKNSNNSEDIDSENGAKSDGKSTRTGIYL